MKPLIIIILEFIDGCWDGMNLCNDSPDPVEVKFMQACYADTENGTIGRKTVVSSEYATRRGTKPGNQYVVTNRAEHDGEILVRLELCCENQRADCSCQYKRILMKFEGGHLSGLRLDSASSDLDEALLATSYFCLTEHGNVGTTMGSGLPLLPHIVRQDTIRPQIGDEYQVVSREEDENRIAVWLRYRSGSHDQTKTK